MHRFLVAALATVYCALGYGTAQAANVQVVVYETGASGGYQQVASWIQDQNPTPIYYKPGFYTTVPVFDAVGLGGDTAVSWYSGVNSQLGGFTNYNGDFNVLAHASYAFTENAPTFVPGDYFGVEVTSNFTYLLAHYTITVLPDPVFKPAFARFNAIAPSVPEPGTWAMMLGGLGLIGLASRRRPQVRFHNA